MNPKRPTLSVVALVLVSMMAFGSAGHLATEAVIRHQQVHQLNELTEVVLRRSELAVDFATASLEELAKRDLASCAPPALQAIRLHVYQRSAIKDVRLVNPDGSVVCSAYSETLEFDKGWADRHDMLPSHDKKLSLFRVEQFGGDALGVLIDVNRSSALVAIVGINAGLLDLMPAELRARTEVIVTLSNGDKLGEFRLLASKQLARPISFERHSTLLPLYATIRLEQSVLSSWNSEAYWPALAVALGLGALFGILLVRSRRMEGPVADLDRALAAGEFKPYYQPIFDLRTGRITGCEVLARWVRRDGAVVPPMNFIPLAESSGRIQVMTWQILRSALSDLEIVLRAEKSFKMSVNVVPKHLLSDGFVEMLRRTVLAARISPRQIVVEVTERDELDDLTRAASVVTELRDHGFRVAIDDVGVGHSGLSRLKGLGANTIKIDKFFVDTITVDASTTTIVEMLVALAKDFRMTVVAEGIETEEQRNALIASGVEEGQGYLVAAPLPFTKFSELVETGRRFASAAPAGDVLVA
jgi:sensor c-di-GMP phosphodiesterase-like protein